MVLISYESVVSFLVCREDCSWMLVTGCLAISPFKGSLEGPWAAALKGGNGGGCLCVRVCVCTFSASDALSGVEHCITPGCLRLLP